MKFRVLGDLRVTDADIPIALPGRLPRQVLALLLCQPQRGLHVERIIDAIYGDCPPKAARNSIQVAVCKLRRVLGPAEWIEFGPDGYRLTAADETIDARTFEATIDDARRLTAADTVMATDAYEAALHLWRGRPFGELDLEQTNREADRLTEVRLSAATEFGDAMLSLGRGDELLAPWMVFVADYPLNEVFRAQLMQALHAAGRTSQALRIYRDGRDLLVAEQGIEPGTRLRRSHEAILSGDRILPI